MAASRAKCIMAAALLVAACPVADGVTRGAIARFRFLQDAGAADLPAEARRPYPLLRLPRREQQRIPARAACARRSAWTEEQSRKNFEMAAILVNPGDPATSRLLQQPLAPEVGGNVFHSGGRQFASKDDPNWKILADWVNGQKL